jgi:hypothetical protein
LSIFFIYLYFKSVYYSRSFFRLRTIVVNLQLVIVLNKPLCCAEDLFYLKEGKYLKYLHNTMMNAFATIYFHNYLR